MVKVVLPAIKEPIEAPMGDGNHLVFSPFVLDITNRSLLRGSEQIPLRPKSFAILRYLVEHAHRLVTKDELLSAVWPRTTVVDAALKVSIGEIRRALGDATDNPHYIQTEGRKGYHFIAPLSLKLAEKPGRDSLVHFVGRDTELKRLKGFVESAKSGKRQLVFVTGEPGIGKTTLIEAFIQNLPTFDGVISAQGQCIEQYGAGEAYLPILDALERMCAGEGGKSITGLLRRYAPSWLANLPAVAKPEERAELERWTVRITPERRLREIAAFLEATTQEKTVLLVLEDLHWVDPSTLALISFLARRPEAARLLLIGTYREGEVEGLNHPLKKVKEELELHHYCSHLPLKLLSPSAVAEYLKARFATSFVSEELAAAVYTRSEGNPLFMVNVTDYLIYQGFIVRQNGAIESHRPLDGASTPTTLLRLIERQFEALGRDEQRLLEAASVRGVSFSAAVVAAALGERLETVEMSCERLVKREQFLKREGTSHWPDGTIASHYGFIHALYQDVIYHRVGDSRKAKLHQSIAERLEAAHRDATEGIAGELALHFERSGDGARAVPYYMQAAQRDFRQSGFQEAIQHAATALAVLDRQRKLVQSKELEARLHLLLGASHASANGYASNKANEAYSRAQSLCGQINDPGVQLQTLAGLWAFQILRGKLRTSLNTGQKMLKLARRLGDPDALLNAHISYGVSFFYLGDPRRAHDHLARAMPHYEFERYRRSASVLGWDPGVLGRYYHAHALCLLGLADRAEQEILRASTLVKELASPFNEAIAHGLLSIYHAYRGDAPKALEAAEACIRVSKDGGFFHWLAVGTLMKGWPLCKQGRFAEGLQCLLGGLESWKSTGAELGLSTYLGLLAEACLIAGKFSESQKRIEEALAISRRNNDCYFDAELYRLKGESLLEEGRRHTNSREQEAEACYHNAIKIARRQKTKLLELRATTGLCRIWQRSGKVKQA
ncbi:MAG: AAA family ATPase, partial [Deltaproteobacteria bacterium]|nr:AAA family ATPase [Deltaproteobacteria bacterium]